MAGGSVFTAISTNPYVLTCLIVGADAHIGPYRLLRRFAAAHRAE